MNEWKSVSRVVGAKWWSWKGGLEWRLGYGKDGAWSGASYHRIRKMFGFGCREPYSRIRGGKRMSVSKRQGFDQGICG